MRFSREPHLGPPPLEETMKVRPDDPALQRMRAQAALGDAGKPARAGAEEFDLSQDVAPRQVAEGTEVRKKAAPRVDTTQRAPLIRDADIESAGKKAPLFVEAEEGGAEEARAKDQRRVPSDVEMPDATQRPPIGMETMRAAPKRPKAAIQPRALSYDKMRSPLAGVLYKALVVLVGVAGLASSFIEMGPWRPDPLWSATITVLGVTSFFLQSLSGLLIVGLFGFFYPLAIFSTQRSAIVLGDYAGVLLIAVQTAFAAVILVSYFILVSRKGSLYMMTEGVGHSIAALLFGVLTLVIVVLANKETGVLPSLGDLLGDIEHTEVFTFYRAAYISDLLQAWFLSLAVAFGFSARALRNRLLMLANIGLFLGFVALLFLYLLLIVPEIQITFL